MKLSEFYYDLPQELIADKPLKARDEARLMVLDKNKQSIDHKIFKNVLDYLDKGDVLVLNNTKVLPVRLYGHRKTGAKVEIFIVNPGEAKLKALVKPSKKIKVGEEIILEGGSVVRVQEKVDTCRYIELEEKLEKVLFFGHMPLPPYIHREDKKDDKEDYQTVFAKNPGSTASPTAGLHFTKELIEKIKNKGVEIVYVTLHTSYGTFAPVKTSEIEDHKMHSEYFVLTKEVSDKINAIKEKGGKVVTVGTTSTRVMESCVEKNKLVPREGETNLFIYPGYRFKIVDRIITNFHLPESTLIMLVSTFSEKDFVFRAYREAIKEKYRFFSYGDAMIIL